MVKFYLSPRPDKRGECPIRVSISIRGTRLISTAGYSIAPEKWKQPDKYSKELACVKKGHNNADGIAYNIINARLKKIDSHFADYEIKLDHKPTIEELADQLAAIKGKTRKGATSDIAPGESPVLVAFDSFLIEEGRANQWTEGTMQCWRAFRSHLEKQQFANLSDINETGIAAFVDYFRTQMKMGENTVQKHYGNLMWFLNWCVRKGYCQDGVIHRYKPKFKVVEKPVIFLTKEELITLYRYQVPANGEKVKLHNEKGEEYEKIVSDASALEKTRDLFCFCAFTSLRYSDMAKLKKTDRVGDTISVTTKKTNDKLQIELNTYSAAILDKYKAVDFPGGLALPVISNQKMNDYIKELGELCEFNTPISRVVYRAGVRVEETKRKWEMLGTHAGRRTFICFALSEGIPPQVVMKWTGHSDYKAMRPYIDIAEATRAEAMKKFNKLED